MGPRLRQVDGTTCGGPPGSVSWTVNSPPLRLSARKAVHVAFREVPVFEVREVLRLWLDGRVVSSDRRAGPAGPQDGHAG